MKINRLLLKNFLGIKLGTGLDEIDLDFTKSKNKIILLIGENGSGKSTIMSNLQPFIKDQNDHSNDIIVPGKEGYKLIELQNDEDIYICEIHYKTGKRGSNKCFIKKNGVDLNVNGNVGSYNEILKNEFGLTEDYFRLGKIALGVKHFLDLSKTDRKRHMSKLLPDVDIYLKKFDIVNTKFRQYKTKINILSDNINRIIDDDLIEEKLNSVNSELNSYSNNKENIIRKSVELDVKTNSINDKIEYFKKEYPNLANTDILSFKRKYDENMSNISRFLEIYPNLSNTSFDELDTKINNGKISINNIENSIYKLNTKLNSLNKNLIDKLNDIDRYNNEIKNLTDKIDDDINNRIVNKTKLFEELDKGLSENGYFDVFNEFDNINVDVRDLKTIYEACEYLLDNVYDIEIFGKKYDIEYNKLVMEMNELSHKIKNLEINKYKMELIEKRPDSCTIDTCPFIVDALKFKGSMDILNGYYSEKISLEEKISKAYDLVEISRDNDKIINKYNYMVNKINSNSNLKYLLKLIGLELPEFGSSFQSKTDIGRFKFIIDDYINTWPHYIEYNKLKDELVLLRSRLNETSSISTNIEIYEKEKNIIKNEVESIKSMIALEEGKLEKLKHKSETLNRSISVLVEYVDIKNELKNSENDITLIKEYEGYLNELKTFNAEKYSLKREISNIDKLISIKEKYKIDILNAKSNKEQYKKDKVELEKNYEIMKYVKDALDIKKGIPLLFTKAYLEKVRHRINKLLSLGFENMTIDFKISEKEFDVLIDDFRQREFSVISGGESAIVKLSFSMGLVHESLDTTKYNILYFDEVDATLDYKRRHTFMDLLNKQIDFMNIEQTFLISHNELLENVGTDLIILSRMEDSVKGNVIYSL